MVSREVGVELYRLEAWQARALAGLELGLKAQAGEPLAAELGLVAMAAPVIITSAAPAVRISSPPRPWGAAR